MCTELITGSKGDGRKLLGSTLPSPRHVKPLTFLVSRLLDSCIFSVSLTGKNYESELAFLCFSNNLLTGLDFKTENVDNLFVFVLVYR